MYQEGVNAVANVICELSATVDAQQKEIDQLREKVAQLSKNSSTSSKPPSSDITKPRRERRQKGKRKIGGQPGHPRHERPAIPEAEIDHFHEYHLTACPNCKNSDVQFLDQEPRVTQQLELNPDLLIKYEHRSFPVWCDECQQTHYHPFPPEVVKEGLFKEKLTALVAFMKGVHHASFSTIRKFIRDVLGEKVSRGYLRKVIEKVSHSLDQPYEELLRRLPLEATLNVDETGHKENAGKFWTWVFRANLYVLFKIDKSRGSQVLVEVLGDEFNGILGCDYFSAYHKYMGDFNVQVQFCVGHLLRDIKYLTTLPDAPSRLYGENLLAALKDMFAVIHESEQLSAIELTRALELARDKILNLAVNEVPSCLDQNGKETKRAAFNMAKRFRENGKAFFEFISTPGIDPTNNLAEQAIRFVVIDRHITQGTRSEKGRKTCERLWTVIATCSLQGRSAFEFILAAVHAYFHDEPSPSLIPDTS